MDLNSLEDLLALTVTRNITLAARRRNISQSAFSRRLLAIEKQYGMKLVDRSVRPALPSAKLDTMRGDIEVALADLRRLRMNLMHGAENDDIIVIAALHTLACGLIPAALNALMTDFDHHRFHLRAANYNDCIQMLMTEQVGIMFTYETAGHPLRTPTNNVERFDVATEDFIPVCAPVIAEKLKYALPGKQSVPAIVYPSDLFLGKVLFHEVFPRTAHIFSEIIVTSLSSAALASARAGTGVAWIPYSLVSDSLKHKELVRLEGELFPSVSMKIVMLQLKTRNTDETRQLWTALAEQINIPLSQPG